MKLPDHFRKRVGMTTIGVTLCAIAVGFFKCSSFGVDPFQSFAQGVWGRFFESFASYGVYYMVLSGLMLALDLLIARSYMGIATLVNMFLTGYIVDFSVCHPQPVPRTGPACPHCLSGGGGSGHVLCLFPLHDLQPGGLCL